jgi:hypothetical protein
MIIKEELQKRYSGLSDFELLEIVNNSQGYTDIAVEAANTEIQKRGISETSLKSY